MDQLPQTTGEARTKQFSENLKERGFEKRRAKTTQTHMVFAGLKLKPEDEGSGGEPSFWAPDR